MPRGRPEKRVKLRRKTYSVKQVAELKKKLAKYINNTEIPIIKEFAYLNNIPRQTLYSFPILSSLLKKAIDKKEANLERKALDNKINVGMAIFSLKQLGWSDKQDLVLDATEDFKDTIKKFFKK